MSFWRGFWMVCWPPSVVTLPVVCVGSWLAWPLQGPGEWMTLVYSAMSLWVACFMILPPWHKITDNEAED